ncbi:MAG: B12-binding domain-containing radical SAM protein [Lentisphaerae bacterium]|nr:B12-binding domain-containing radical SAM protein [Lentisphaerota bacterium]
MTLGVGSPVVAVPDVRRVGGIHRVLLINPFHYDGRTDNVGIDPVVLRHAGQQIKTGVTFPIGLAYMAAMLKRAGVAYRLIDPLAEAVPLSRIRDAAAWADAIVTPFSPAHQDDTRRLFAEHSHALRILCGSVSEHVFEHLFRQGVGDVVILGEPEETIVELARLAPDLAGVDGIAYRNPDGSATRTKPRPPVKDLDSLAFPVRDFTSPDRYWDISYFGKPTAWILPTRGCPSRCRFCAQWGVNQRSIRRRSPKNLVDEIEQIVREQGIHHFVFFDEIFNVAPSHVHAVCDEILRRGLKISWWCAARADCVRPDVVRKMKAAGCVEMRFGLESANNEILEYLLKDTTVEKLRHGMEVTRAAGMNFSLHVIFGSPMETPATIRRTLDFVKAVKPLFVSFNVLTPLPGSQLFEEFKDKIDLSSGLKSFDILHTDFQLGTMTPAELQQVVKRAYLEYYLSPGFIGRVLRQGVRQPRMLGWIAKTLLVQARYLARSVMMRKRLVVPVPREAAVAG